ncbi:MAG: Crp/Fnr family transcriptional regulator [Saprospiraceae bacterium]|nr:Crp/Fnr family transcriptional regulator [Lewinella sp.]
MLERITEKIYPISRTSLQALESLIEVEIFEKRATFVRAGKPNDKEYFVLDGVCRSYLLNPKGEEITISFYTADSVLAPHLTRTRAGISRLNYQALAPLKVASIAAAAFDQLRIDNAEIRNFAQVVLQNELYRKVEKEIGLASLTAKDRLLEFRAAFPMLENIVPHPDIASYLGITNISLSRLRKELKK